jgi:hypothetical protein
MKNSFCCVYAHWILSELAVSGPIFFGWEARAGRCLIECFENMGIVDP